MLNIKPVIKEDRPALVLIEGGRDSLINNYRPMTFPKDRSLVGGIIGSIVLHVGLVILAGMVFQSFMPAGGQQAVAAGTSGSIFEVEIIGNYEEPSLDPVNELEAIEIPKEAPVAPILEKPVPVVSKPVKKEVSSVKKPLASKLGDAQQANDVEFAGIGNAGVIGLGNGVAPPNYAQMVAAKIAANKIYPRRARERGIEGKVVISLTLAANGSVIDTDLISTDSGLLSDGVEQMIQSASPFPAIPSELGTERVTLQVPIRFNLNAG